MTDIPEDVMSAAFETMCCIQGEGDGSEDGWVPDYDHVCAIARAIMAERERCCRFIETHQTIIAGETADPMMEEILHSIRRGDA